MRAPCAHVSKRTTGAPRNKGVLPCGLRASRIRTEEEHKPRINAVNADKKTVFRCFGSMSSSPQEPCRRGSMMPASAGIPI